jgi:polar amino acid transport system substrate-binding protein
MLLRARCFLAIMLLSATTAFAEPINLLTEDAYPFQYLDNQHLTGMAVDVVTEMFKRAGLAHKDQLMSWEDAYDRVQIHPNTCVFSTARTENREHLFKWIGPIVENKWAVFAKKGFKGDVAGPADLKQYRIGVLKGDAKERYLMDVPVTFRVPQADDSMNPPLLTLDRTELHKIDLWATGYYSGMHIAAKAGVKDIYPVWVFQSSENYLACGSSLTKEAQDKLQSALRAMKLDGTYAGIVSRYEKEMLK